MKEIEGRVGRSKAEMLGQKFVKAVTLSSRVAFMGAWRRAVRMKRRQRWQ